MADNYFEKSSDEIDQWHLQRWSKFTSSKIQCLTGKGDFGLGFQLGGYNYIKEKAVQLTTRMWSNPKLEEVEPLKHGLSYELPAYQRYVQETKNHSMMLMGTDNPMFIPDTGRFEGEAGGSPDVVNIASNENGIVKIDFGAEIKNPWNPSVHFERLDWKSQFDIKQHMPVYYGQIQDMLRLTGAYEWHFVSFDERQIAKAMQIKIIPVKREENYINNLEARLSMAIQDKYKIISKKFKTQIKNRTEFLQFANAA